MSCPAVLTIIHGFLGAGKTTFSKKLAAETGAVRLNADEYCQANFSETEREEKWEDCFTRAVQALWSEAERRIKQGESVILDLGFWTRESREHAREQARKLGCACVHYYIWAPDEVLMERLSRRSGPIAQRNLARFFEIKKEFQAPCPDEPAIVIENCDL